MHATSLENMRRCYLRYVAGTSLEERAELIVLDVGGADVNGSYRPVFDRPNVRYLATDLEPGPGIDVVIADPNRLPFEDGFADIVISGQALEHAPFFWITFAEMVRVLRPDGFLFVIVPSSGPIHRYPVDCYRFYPDSLAAMATFAGCTLVENWLDERGPWRDLVGVFRRSDAPPLSTSPSLERVMAMQSIAGEGGSAEEEAVNGKLSYLEVLERLHRELRPSRYLEIGVRHGASLALARGPAIGVDPSPDLDHEPAPGTRIVAMTSDDYFASGNMEPIDFCFIDGMHLFEYALRDFMNVERRASQGAIVIIDDVSPNHPAQADRVRRTRNWAGDVWRLAWILEKYRPDLFLCTFDAAPTGLLLVAGLDPRNRILWDAYNPIVREAAALGDPPPAILERRGAIDPRSTAADRLFSAIAGVRSGDTAALVEELRIALREPEPKLSIVVVGFNMARELPRTIRSLSPPLQLGIEPGEYEVIVVDNASTQPFDEDALRTEFPGLIIHRVRGGGVAPGRAINVGLAAARGDLVGVFIDGARMASPRLLARALAASRLHARPIVGTIAFHLGPDRQQASVLQGYDRHVEDELLARTGWERDPYRLFGVSTIAPSSSGGWFALPRESNAFFLRAEHWREIGGWDERFTSPGGGLVNTAMWLKLCGDPTAEIIMLLGEATFHQVHGGISTNLPDPPFDDFREEYVRLVGSRPVAPTRMPLFFGTFTPGLSPHNSTNDALRVVSRDESSTALNEFEQLDI